MQSATFLAMALSAAMLIASTLLPPTAPNGPSDLMLMTERPGAATASM